MRHGGHEAKGVSLYPIGWRLGGKFTHRVSTFVWAFPMMSLLLCRYCWKGLQSSLGRNLLIGSPLLFGHFPKCLYYSGGIAKKAPNPLWAFPKELPRPLRFCSNLQELLGAFPNMSRHGFGHFLYISLEAACFCLLRFKIGDTLEKFKIHQWFFS